MKSVRNFFHLYNSLFNVIFLILFLYLFLLSLELMGTSLKMFGKGLAEGLIKSTTFLSGYFKGFSGTMP